MDRAQLWKLNSKLDIVNKHSFKVNRPSLSITIRRLLSFWTIFTSPWIIWNVHLLMDLMFSLHLKKRERWKTVTDRLTDILLLGDRSVVWKLPHSSLKRNWIGVDEFKIRKKGPRLRWWPEQLAVCFLCRVRVRTSDFRFVARTFLARIFCPWICWNDMSSKHRCKLILGWKLETVVGSYSSPFILRAFKQISTKSGQARTQVSFQFSRFHTISFNVAETSVISVAVFLFVLSSLHFSVGW